MKKSKLLACLKSLGIEPTMETFDDRKKMQKVSYWLPIFGLDVGVYINSYNWYLHGPYNPELTRTLFEILENPNEVIIGQLTEEEKNKIRKLKMFLGEDIDSIDRLELLVSLHFLLHHAKRFGTPMDVVIEILKDKKPYFKDIEIQRALRKIRMLSYSDSYRST